MNVKNGFRCVSVVGFFMCVARTFLPSNSVIR